MTEKDKYLKKILSIYDTVGEKEAESYLNDISKTEIKTRYEGTEAATVYQRPKNQPRKVVANRSQAIISVNVQEGEDLDEMIEFSTILEMYNARDSGSIAPDTTCVVRWEGNASIQAGRIVTVYDGTIFDPHPLVQSIMIPTKAIGEAWESSVLDLTYSSGTPIFSITSGSTVSATASLDPRMSFMMTQGSAMTTLVKTEFSGTAQDNRAEVRLSELGGTDYVSAFIKYFSGWVSLNATSVTGSYTETWGNTSYSNNWTGLYRIDIGELVDNTVELSTLWKPTLEGLTPTTRTKTNSFLLDKTVIPTIGLATPNTAGQITVKGIMIEKPEWNEELVPVTGSLPNWLTNAWEATSISAIDDEPVSSWTDSIGGMILSQSSGPSQPLWKEGNGIPYLKFDGSNDYMTSGLSSAQPNTMIAVVSFTSLNPQAVTDGDTVSGRHSLYVDSGGMRMYAGTTKTIGAPDIARHFNAAVFNGASSFGRVDNDVSTISTAGTNDLSNMRIGANNSTSSFLGGKIYAIYFASNYIASNSDLDELYEYCQNKWGI